ncbi:MAG: hypothetical protein OEZ38_09080 [Gammaproteobacteria bacterium]|nr:hypothetical protein [Gammaproteobacteria bacterium]
MANRKPIKQAHEHFHVENFLNWLNHAYRTDFKVIAEPDPPEAIIKSSRRTSWVEISTAFLNSAYAQDVLSYATPGETHKSIAGGLTISPDEQFAHSLVGVIKKKLEKKSYFPFYEKYGPGYLVIPIHNPFLDEESMKRAKAVWSRTIINDFGYFRSIRVAYKSLGDWKLKLWKR